MPGVLRGIGLVLVAIEYTFVRDMWFPLCAWCFTIIFPGELVGNKDYAAHDECHEIQV